MNSLGSTGGDALRMFRSESGQDGGNSERIFLIRFGEARQMKAENGAETVAGGERVEEYALTLHPRVSAIRFSLGKVS